MIFSERNKKKNLVLYLCLILLLSGGIFFLTPSVASAASVVSLAGDIITVPIKGLIYAIFVLFGWFASVAIILFQWALTPGYISGSDGLLNHQAIYEMWKFIRDFFNLFFILVLLYIAFTVVFQIQKNFKQALLSLVLAALFVNFSFPISRALIDATNVPMYFFANQMLGSDGKVGVFNSALSVSNMKGILIPGAEDGGTIAWVDTDMSRFLVGTIFMFLFSVTLLVLAVMFIIRLMALMILVVFSSVGFAASIIPGLDKYSKMWWDSFWKYTIFGPAAMLMLLIAVHFFSVIGDSQVRAGVDQVASSVVADEPGFIASMAMFSLPIILLWMAIGLGQTMAIAGAATVSGKGKAFAKWVGKKTYNNPVGRGLGGGLKEKTGINKFQKWMARPNSWEAAIKGGVIGVGTAAGVRGGARKELVSIREKEVQEKLEEHKKNKTNASILEEDLKSKDGVKRKAAALALADSKDITSPERLHLALAAVAGDMDRYAKVLQSADGKAMGLSADEMQKAVAERDENGEVKKDAAGNITVNDNALKAIKSKMKKEGRVDVIIDYRVKKEPGANQGSVVREEIEKLSATEIPKQGDLLNHSTYGNDARIAVMDYQNTDPDYYQQIKRNATGGVNKLI